MFFDYKKRRTEIWVRHKQDANLMRKEGITEQDITDLLALDNHELYSDTNFYTSLDGYIDPQHNLAIPGGGAPDSGLDFMDNIKNEELYRAMMSLKPEDRELVIKHVVDGITLRQIAEYRNEPYEKVKKRYFRTVQKIKNIF